MNILVTGGAGFIGSHIVGELLKYNHFVVALDNLYLGTADNLRVFSGLQQNGVVFVKGDVRDFDLISKVVREYGIEAVSHQAAVSSAPMFVPDPREGVDANIRGFLNILEAARRFDIGKVVYASTSSIYNVLPPPHREDMHVQPRTFYEYSLWMREHAAKIYYDLYGIETIGLRYFSIYGPREQHKGRYANIVSQFLWKMLKGEAPVIFGDGSQTRDFTFVKDVAEANILALEKKGLGGEVFNVGTGKETTFNEVVELLNKHLGTNIQPKYEPNPIKNYVYRTQADTSKAKRLLGFEAKTDLETGIRIIIDYYRRVFSR
ncbi:MAG: NAD-dependent epimerase/dehydratase family protein [Candidatus Njordarchaeia archaeon]